MKKAVYAGSFDPVTNGHMYIIRQGALLFEELVVAVGTNQDKSYRFSAEERVDLLNRCTADIPNLEVTGFQDQYLVHFAAAIGATHLLRGIRNEHDYHYERTMRHVNQDINPDISSIYLMPPRYLSEVSSSFVKGLVGAEGWEAVVTKYVPVPVLEALRHQHKGG